MQIGWCKEGVSLLVVYISINLTTEEQGPISMMVWGNLVQNEGWSSLPAVIARKFRWYDFMGLWPGFLIYSANLAVVVLICFTLDSDITQLLGHLKLLLTQLIVPQLIQATNSHYIATSNTESISVAMSQ